jgi:hypothetical protein
VTRTAPTSLKPQAARIRRRRWLGYAGFGWALSNIPIHIYWALGGLTTSIGITTSGHDFRIANWGASLVILGAGLTCLALVQRWGEVLPRALLHGTAWVGGVLGIVHSLAFGTGEVLRLAGIVSYPDRTDFTLRQLQNFDWANLLYFEPWFAVMGVLLIGSSLSARRRARAAAADTGSSSRMWTRRVGWARPVSVAVLGIAALLHLAWASGAGLLIPARAGDAAPRLVELGQIGSYRLADSVAAALLAALALAVARGWPVGWRLGGTTLTLAGLFTVIWGVYTFDPWTFAGYGPALIAAGLLTLFARIASSPGSPEKEHQR